MVHLLCRQLALTLASTVCHLPDLERVSCLSVGFTGWFL